MNKRLYLLVLALLLPMGILFPGNRPLNIENISLEQGLSQSSVNFICRDQKGFIWLATQDGLNRYDGYEFKVYKPDSTVPSSISDNHIRVVIPDKRERALWIATDSGGLNKFDLMSETFTHYLHAPSDPHSLSSNEIYSLYLDGNEVLWVGTWGGGLNKFDRNKNNFTRYKHDPANPHSISSNIVRAIYEDKTGALWVGTYGGGLSKFDRTKEEFTHFHNIPGRPDSLSDNRVMTICETSRGSFWVGTDGGGICRLDRETGKFTRYTHNPKNPGSIGHNRVRVIHEDHYGSLWIGTYGGGLNLFDYETNTFKHCRLVSGSKPNHSANAILSIYEDNTDLIWIGTVSGGIYKVERREKKFQSYFKSSETLNSLSSGIVRAILEDSEGILWLGTNGGGLNKFDRKKNKYTHYKNNPDDPKTLAYDRVYALHQDRNPDILWVATFNGGLDKFDKKREVFKHYSHNPLSPASLSNNRLRAMCEDHTGEIWLGTWGSGLDKFNPQKETFKHYRHDPDTPNSLSHDKIYCIYEDRQKVLWIGTYGGGLNRYNREKDNFIRVGIQPENPNTLRENRIFCIYEDSSGLLWLGTAGSGLHNYDRKNDKWTSYSTGDGLPSNVVYSILEDRNGNIWLSSNNGLSKFNTRSRIFVHYDTEDGLQSNEFNGGAHFKSITGEMFFGGINGFNSFFPFNVKDNPHIPPVYITNFKIFNKPVKTGKAISETKEIQLSYKDKFFAFDFVALSYRAPQKNHYAYMLEGFDRDWIFCGTRRTATYTNLNGGTYTFRVRGTNNDGLWNTEGTAIKVLIAPPIWKQWWFVIMIIAIIFMLILAIFRFRTYRIRERNKELEKINSRLNEQIVERRRVEAALRKSEEKFRTIFENSIDVHYRADMEGKLRMINPAGIKLLGYSQADEALGKDIAREFYSNPEDREGFLEALNKNGRVTNFLVTLKRKDGQKIQVETNSRIIYDENNNPVALEGVFRDVTARKIAEEDNIRLQVSLRKMEAVGTLAGGMAHEFNNLMATIIGNAGLLQSKITDDRHARKWVDKIMKSANRCADLTEQLLSYSMKQMLQLRKIKLNDLIQEIDKDICQITGENIEVAIEPDEGLEPIEADPGMIKQVIMGIVHNARDAMPNGGLLTIKTEMVDTRELENEKIQEQKGRFACLSIDDTGIGMDEETLQHIFEPFFTTKATGQGIGLALSSVYGTVKQHKGWIEVDSAPGKGTTFFIGLPAIKQ